MNVQSSTEGELVAVDNAATMILWTKLFLEAQGYDVEKIIVYQDNESAILLETNGKKSSGKQMRALNIRSFFITNQVEKNAQIGHCGTDNMVSDFFTKPLQGKKFLRFRDDILGRLTARGASKRRDVTDDVKSLKGKKEKILSSGKVEENCCNCCS
jgi:hypothetical protein